MKRSLLIKVGLALAPDVFDIALDSENEAKATINVEKTQEGFIKQMNARAQQYIKCIAKIPGHLERLGAENDLERYIKPLLYKTPTLIHSHSKDTAVVYV